MPAIGQDIPIIRLELARTTTHAIMCPAFEMAPHQGIRDMPYFVTVRRVRATRSRAAACRALPALPSQQGSSF